MPQYIATLPVNVRLVVDADSPDEAARVAVAQWQAREIPDPPRTYGLVTVVVRGPTAEQVRQVMVRWRWQFQCEALEE